MLMVFLTAVAYADWSSLLQSFTGSKASLTPSTSITSFDRISAIKEALKTGTKYAVSNLSKQNGFLSNPKVKIPLPSSLQKAANIVKKYGGKEYVDDFEAAINHAAEKAVPQTYEIFQNSIKNLSIEDAKKLLKGGDGSITNFFKEKDSKLLYEKIYPIVKNSIRNINVMHYYDSFKGYYGRYMPKVSLGESTNSILNSVINIAKQTGVKKYMINLSEKSLDDYVTKKSIDGLFYMIAQQESKIRKNPLAYSTGIIKKVFSAYMKK
jgi:hypothetical protein